MLAIAKNFKASQRSLRSRVMNAPVSEELAGHTLGIIGFGASGRALAVRAVALDMRVMAIDIQSPSQDEVKILGIDWCGGPSSLATLLRTADYVSIHVPLTQQTRNMLDAEALELMKPTSALINVSRGAIVNEAALAEHLRRGDLRGAGIDVYTKEPPDIEHPLLNCEGVIATPHIAGVSSETSRRRAMACVKNIQRLKDGLPLLYQVEATI